MNLSSAQLDLLIAIIATYVELLDDRAAYWYGDINSQKFTQLLNQRQEAYLIECKLREVKLDRRELQILVNMDDRTIDRN
jgi:hypothetical protein